MSLHIFMQSIKNITQLEPSFSSEAKKSLTIIFILSNLHIIASIIFDLVHAR